MYGLYSWYFFLVVWVGFSCVEGLLVSLWFSYFFLSFIVWLFLFPAVVEWVFLFLVLLLGWFCVLLDAV